MVDQNDSIIVLSTELATRPIEPSRPAREPVAEDPGRERCPVGVQDRSGLGLAVPAGHLQGVDDQLGAHVVGDRPADDPAGETSSTAAQ